MIKKPFTVLVVLIFFFLSACSSSDIQSREKGALVGGAIGAGLGAIIGHQTGRAGEGVAIGAAIGGLSGGILGSEMDKTDARMDEQEERLKRQEAGIVENQRMINELRRRGVDVYQDKRGVVVNLPDVLFKFNEANLTRGALEKVKDIAEVIREYPERSVDVEGHTDSLGTIAYNKELSEARARAVADELVAEGISRRRIITAGYGESRPVASNKTEDSRQKNRRVEVVIR